MKIEIITLFPDFFEQSIRQSLLGKALEKKLFDIKILNLRDFTTDKHLTVDDTPYGGGGGMVLKLEPIDLCLQSLGYKPKTENIVPEPNKKERILLTSAAGKKFVQDRAIELSLCERMTIICGHYLGIDERILKLYDMDELSIGDYILTGGEAAAFVITEAVVRLIPKVLGNFESALGDSYMNQMLGTPCYTRPADYFGFKVPDMLMSGDHVKIKKFRRFEAVKKCLNNRPDLINKDELTNKEIEMLKNDGFKIEDK
ncbi:MAG: tRNA (guanosine(37)-N1)-methyltransferase TrmD [Candidatus Zixiibacteriota bacterium]|nr:MAG: tRNA (guanosine(37)-N1)-methyltransferase TrmD [candidate division Zixibacteria bacterium]